MTNIQTLIAALIRRIRGHDSVEGIMSSFDAAATRLETLAGAEADRSNRCHDQALALRTEGNVALIKSEHAYDKAAKLREFIS